MQSDKLKELKYDKLQKYITFNRDLEDNPDQATLRECTPNDFKNLGYHSYLKSGNLYGILLCADQKSHTLVKDLETGALTFKRFILAQC